MSDLIMSYGLLNQAASDISNLGPEVTRIQNTIRGNGKGLPIVPGATGASDGDLGPGMNLYRALGSFYETWQTPAQNAMDGLDKLGGYFKQVADAFQEIDASTAGGINAGTAISDVLRYPELMDQYNNALMYMVNPQGQQAYAAPTMPTPIDDPFSLPGTTGLSTTYTMGGQDPDSPPGVKSSSWPNDLVASETTTVTQDGMNYSETTTFGPDKGWGPDSPTQDTTQVITNPDGSTDTIKTVIDPGNGSGTMTDLNSASKQTTTYTRAGWDATWVNNTPNPTTNPTTNPSNRPPSVIPR
jgi:hypothetical protein